MKLLFTAACLFASHAAAAKYPAGKICHSNVECANNCVGAQWTIGCQDNDYVLECDRTVPNPQQFYLASCQVYYVDPDDGGEPHWDVALTIAACAAVNGTSCEEECILSGKRSVEGDTRSGWTKACNTGKVPVRIVKFDSEESARADSVFC